MKQGIALMVVVGVLFTFMAVAFKKSERNDCYKWQRQAKEYPGFFMADWQKLQCQSLEIPVLTK